MAKKLETVVLPHAHIVWTEWEQFTYGGALAGGWSRKAKHRPKPVKYESLDAHVSIRGATATITIEGKAPFRKRFASLEFRPHYAEVIAP